MQSVQGHDTDKLLAHKMIAELCVEMALGIYEYYARHNNKWYRANKSPEAVAQFVKKCAPTLREHAVVKMAEMCGRKDVPEDWKEMALEAMVLHKSLHRAASASGAIYG